ncbi:hypothetical protein HAX54_043918 [Datura stramonium]|uniref:Uncharacterized protein n=1 Tax=Datura stramonium TaxID=4076 RepID=A0ABS8W578_DATST|nr:hypothetical protein [Datura stramonium]
MERLKHVSIALTARGWEEGGDQPYHKMSKLATCQSLRQIDTDHETMIYFQDALWWKCDYEIQCLQPKMRINCQPLHPPPSICFNRNHNKRRLETSGKMPARNPADKVHYIVQGLATYLFSDFGTGRSQNGTIGEKSGSAGSKMNWLYSKKALFFEDLSRVWYCMVPLCKNPESVS